MIEIQSLDHKGRSAMTTTEVAHDGFGGALVTVPPPVGFDAVVEPPVPRPVVPRGLSFGIVLTVVALVVTSFVVGQMQGHVPVATQRREVAAARHLSADCQAAVRAADR